MNERQKFGHYLARLRRAAGMSQREFAELLCRLSRTASITRHEVSRWESGKRLPETWLPVLAEALNVPLSDLQRAAAAARWPEPQPVPTIVPGIGLAARHWETAHDECAATGPPPSRVPEPATSPWTPAAAVDIAARMTRTDLLMDRRTASRALATTTVGAALLDSLEGWLQPRIASTGRRMGRLGVREVEQVEETARLMRQWDRRYGGGLRRRAVLGQLAEIADALGEHQAQDIERRLFCVMADLAGKAAGMAWDSGMHRAAQDYYRLALRAAHAGGDRAFGANILAGMARQMLYRNQDRPQDALELVRLAQEGSGSRGAAGPRVRAMLYTREAWAYASLGRPVAFRRAADKAAEVLATAGPADEEPYWIGYFGEAELAGTIGGRLLDLARQEPGRGHAEAAAEQIGAAVELRGTEAARSHALDQAGLAECAWLMGDVRMALVQTHRAIDVAGLTQSTQVRAKLGRLYPYTVGHTANRQVRETRHLLRELLPNSKNERA